MRSQLRKKQQAVDYLGSKCSQCGYSKCLQALDFHHIDPKTKEANPSYIVMRWAWHRVKRELDKCIVLCRNCHAEVHYGHISVTEINIRMKPLIILRCLQCSIEFDTHNKDQMYCKPRCKQLSDRKVVRPNKEQLKIDIDTMNWCAVGRKYGVTDNAVRKWARTYKLLHPKL